MIRNIIRANSVIAVLLAAALLVYPSGRAIQNIRDPALKGPGIPQAVWRLERNLTPRYAAWAQERARLGRAENLSTNNISGTEWPLFGSVFYLWATESLQDAWGHHQYCAPVAPKVFAHEAIEAATQLVIDPKQANWVKIHWGTNYLKTENVFYRMLVISALTSHARLTGDRSHLPFLRDQTDSLSAELDASQSGLLDDYPDECYPGDVLTAI